MKHPSTEYSGPSTALRRSQDNFDSSVAKLQLALPADTSDHAQLSKLARLSVLSMSKEAVESLARDADRDAVEGDIQDRVLTRRHAGRTQNVKCIVQRWIRASYPFHNSTLFSVKVFYAEALGGSIGNRLGSLFPTKNLILVADTINYVTAPNQQPVGIRIGCCSIYFSRLIYCVNLRSSGRNYGIWSAKADKTRVLTPIPQL